jgi:GT2 family glycosyltransferase
LRKCLDALIGKFIIPVEIIVVDAGSNDGTVTCLESIQGIRLIKEGVRLGQAHSLNKIIKSLDSSYLCWLSDDNIAFSHVLSTAVDILDANQKIGMVGLKVKDVSGPNVDQPYIGGIWSSGILCVNQGVVRTDLMQKIGGFDVTFRDYGIDGDLTTRVLLEGFQVVITKEVAIHHYRDHESDSWATAPEREEKMRRAIELYNQKYANIILVNHGRTAKNHLAALVIQIVNLIYRVASKMNVSLEAITGVNSRDWRNIMLGRFISKYDFMINKTNPYYLVQQIDSTNER